MLFATQVGTEPPTIVLKVNDAVLFDDSWKRYLLGVFREELPFKEVPLKVYYRSRDAQTPAKAAQEDAAIAAEIEDEAAEPGGEWDE